MDRLEEIETIAACKSASPNLLNDLVSMFFSPFLRFFYNFSPHLVTIDFSMVFIVLLTRYYLQFFIF